MTGTCGAFNCVNLNGAYVLSKTPGGSWDGFDKGIFFTMYYAASYWYLDAYDGVTLLARWRVPDEDGCPTETS